MARLMVLVLALAIAGWFFLGRQPKRTETPSESAPAVTEKSSTAPPALPALPDPVPEAHAPATVADAPAKPSPEEIKEIIRQGRANLAKLAQEAPPPAGLGDRHAPGTAAPRPAGRITKEAVREGIHSAKSKIGDCYAQALERTPDLGGVLTVKFTLVTKDGTGTMRDAEITEDSLGNPFLAMCALKALGKVEYDMDTPDGEVVVNYPFRLNPTADPKTEK